MRHYELVTILSPMLNQDDASAIWDEIKSFITNREGEITAEQLWGTRRLAYPIRKGNYNFLEGSYYLSSFTADNPFNRELENYLRLHDDVLRALVVRCDGPLADKPPPGPLTAPSRYIPPGRGRRNDGGGPIPEAPAPAAERGSGPPPAATPAAPSSETPGAPVAQAAPEAPSAEPSAAPVAQTAPEAPPAEPPAAPAAQAAPEAPSAEPPAAPAAQAAPEAPPAEPPAAQAPPADPPAPEAQPEPPAAAPEPAAGESAAESEA